MFFSNFIYSNEKAYQDFFIVPPINFSCEKVISVDSRSAINYKVFFPYDVFDEKWNEKNILKEKPDCIFYFSCYKNREEHIRKLTEINYSLGYLKDTGRCSYAIFKK